MPVRCSAQALTQRQTFGSNNGASPFNCEANLPTSDTLKLTRLRDAAGRSIVDIEQRRCCAFHNPDDLRRHLSRLTGSR